MKIWEYELLVTDMQKVAMPEGAQILSVGNQNNKLCLWALVNPDKSFPDRHMEVRHIEIIGTGNPIVEPASMVTRNFIGTVIWDPFVWHVFERPDKK